MGSKGPRAGYFFKTVFVSGLIGLLIALIVCGITLGVRNDKKKGLLSYEKAVFLGAAGQNFPLEHKLTSVDNQGRNVGLYFRDATAAGIGLKESILCLERAQEIASSHTSFIADWLLAVLKERYSISLPQSIYSAVDFTDGYWNFFDDKDRSRLAQILQGEESIPTTFDEYEILPLWLILLFAGILQSVAFIGYLGCCSEDNYCWYAFSWRQGWPFFGMLLFIPGGSPFLILMGGSALLTNGWGRAKNIIAKKSRAGQFDHEAFIHESRARVKKLRTTIGGKK